MLIPMRIPVSVILISGDLVRFLKAPVLFLQKKQKLRKELLFFSVPVPVKNRTPVQKIYPFCIYNPVILKKYLVIYRK